MVTSVPCCQFCGRTPAKYCSFSAHQGFIVFRREIDVSGTLCRDCAIEAYVHARSISLKGMWFSPTTILLGTLSTVWDSVKLLNLPPEITDSPWVWHKVGCPQCGHATKTFSGKCKCAKCSAEFAVLSCIHCKTVNSVKTEATVDAVRVDCCRKCNGKTEAPTAARNTPFLIVGRIFAEIAGQVHQDVDPVPIDEWLAAFIGSDQVADQTVWWLWDQFERRINDRRLTTLKETAGAQQVNAIHFALQMAFHVCTGQQREFLKLLAVHFGLHFGDEAADSHSQNFAEACEVLGLSESTTRKEAERIYRKLAMHAHPDRMASKSHEQEAEAIEKMKAVNAAFSVVCEHLDSGQAPGTDRLAPWRNPEQAAEVRRRADSCLPRKKVDNDVIPSKFSEQTKEQTTQSSPPHNADWAKKKTKKRPAEKNLKEDQAANILAAGIVCTLVVVVFGLAIALQTAPSSIETLRSDSAQVKQLNSSDTTLEDTANLQRLPGSDLYAMRQWNSSDYKSSTFAKFVKIEGSIVTLQNPKNQIGTFPLSRLSSKDVDFLDRYLDLGSIRYSTDDGTRTGKTSELKPSDTTLENAANLKRLPESGLYAIRQWNSSEYQFSTSAKFVKLKDSIVTLQKSNKRTIQVPLSRLSSEDFTFLDQYFDFGSTRYRSDKE